MGRKHSQPGNICIAANSNKQAERQKSSGNKKNREKEWIIKKKIVTLPTQNESWYGVSMLSSVLESDTAIEANRRIMRAFVMFHHLKTLPLPNAYDELKKEIEKVKDEMNEILADQNDINESTGNMRG